MGLKSMSLVVSAQHMREAAEVALFNETTADGKLKPNFFYAMKKIADVKWEARKAEKFAKEDEESLQRILKGVQWWVPSLLQLRNFFDFSALLHSITHFWSFVVAVSFSFFFFFFWSCLYDSVSYYQWEMIHLIHDELAYNTKLSLSEDNKAFYLRTHALKIIDNNRDMLDINYVLKLWECIDGDEDDQQQNDMDLNGFEMEWSS